MNNKFTYYFITAALLLTWSLHLAMPLCYSLSLSGIKDLQHELIESGLMKGEYEQLALSNETFSKAYNTSDKELNWNNTQYDVVSYTKEGNTIICKVLKDEEETRMDNRINENHTTQNNLQRGKQLIYWWPLAHHHPEAFALVVTYSGKQDYCIYNNAKTLGGNRTILPRPPDAVLIS
ncbi:MAG: hypothetical protein JST82_00915 [Bacteroidetes bacterium]|nr:hypothetical protein [Bacteroidota bacterium]